MGASEKAELAFQKDYPAVYRHLFSFKSQLENRNKAETGIRYEWYALQRWGANYWEDFFKQKIIYSEIVREPQFYFDKNDHFFAEATSFFMTGNDLEYLYGILHSKLFTYFFKTFYSGGGLGEKGIRYKKVFLEKLPIPKLKMGKEKINNNDFYDFFGLNANEINWIEKNL